MERRKINIDNQEFEYLQIGSSGPALICLHGWAASYKNYSYVIPFLSKYFRLYLFDLPGNNSALQWNRDYYIEDYVYFLFEFINRLNLKEIYLLGESFGSLLALQCLFEKRKEIKGVILISLVMSYPKTINAFLVKVLMRIRRKKIVLKFISLLKKNEFFQNYWINLLIEKNISHFDEIQELTMSEMKNVSPEAYIDGYISILKSNTPVLLKNLLEDTDIKKILIYGKKDPFSKWETIDNVSNTSEIVIIDGTRHSPHLERPDNFFKVLKEDFIDHIL